MPVKFCGGVPIMFTNEIPKENKEEGYYISYNPSIRDYGVDTTALVIDMGKEEMSVFYILRGNHSEEFKKCETLKECIKYLISKKDEMHEMSEKFKHDHLL